jgi:hypothetical protein
VKTNPNSPDSAQKRSGDSSMEKDDGEGVGRAIILILAGAFTVGILFLVAAVWLDWS